jgi:hypothetical protein
MEASPKRLALSIASLRVFYTDVAKLSKEIVLYMETVEVSQFF